MWYVVSKSRNANTVHFRGNEIIINNVNEGFIFKVVPGGKVARTRYGFVRWSLEAHEAHWRLVVYEVTDSGVMRCQRWGRDVHDRRAGKRA